MLQHSYTHIKGIGVKREKQLWEQGALTWEDAIKNLDGYMLSNNIRKKLEEDLPKSIRLFKEKNYRYFLYHLPEDHYYRAYPYLMDKTVFLDIETTGFSVENSHITVIGCYDGKEPRVFIFGQNERDFIEYIKKFAIVVTFNGKMFDIPFLEKYFAIHIQAFHIDMRNVLSNLGYRGGLKRIEVELGLSRPGEVSQANGYTAVLLWEYYKKTGDKRALDTLIHYNLLDTINLQYLLTFAYNEYAKNYNFTDCILEEKKLPEIHYNYNSEILMSLKSYKYKKK